jgi:hypothetical protein
LFTERRFAMKILVVGAAGVIGRRLVPLLGRGLEARYACMRVNQEKERSGAAFPSSWLLVNSFGKTRSNGREYALFPLYSWYDGCFW